MRKVILISILIFISQIVLGQKALSKIDSLGSKAEVEKFVRSFLNEDGEFTLIADSLNTQPFYKTDFDKNGLTDLLANGSMISSYGLGPGGREDVKYRLHTFIVMNFGKDSLRFTTLSRGYFPDFEPPQIINDTIIALNKKQLIFKFGNFIEFNPQSRTYKIEKVEYQTTHCYGACPVFYIQINKDKTGIFKAEDYNSKSKINMAEYFFGNKASSKEIKGRFKAVIKDDSYSNIIDLLNYIDFPNLDDSYSVSWTDDQSCVLTITYDNGKRKRIKDYGLIGTYGLGRLYQLLFELRFNQDWE